jgi:hypothetical protein
MTKASGKWHLITAQPTDAALHSSSDDDDEDGDEEDIKARAKLVIGRIESLSTVRRFISQMN